jgi:lambda family phage portal protein
MKSPQSWWSRVFSFNKPAQKSLRVRNYEAAKPGRRTQGWARQTADINTITAQSLSELRLHSRDLVRNNAWAQGGLESLVSNTIGWGIIGKAIDGDVETANTLWKEWAESTDCDADGRLTFAGLQELAFRTVVESGECLIRRRLRRPEDGLTIPFQLQVLEPDHIDTNKNGVIGPSGGPINQGIEYDLIGRRTAYWLFPKHPGSVQPNVNGKSHNISVPVPASEVIHVYRILRPGQVRGIPWLAATITPLKDFDEYEDASLMKQKVSACFVGAVTDADGDDSAVGDTTDQPEDVEEFQPGTFTYLPPGRSVTFGNPPPAGDDDFTERTLRKIAKGFGSLTYEEFTNDLSNVNYSSLRFGRLSHFSNVRRWQWNMLIPGMCVPIWNWFNEVALLAGELRQPSKSSWTPPPMQMIEPDKEGLAYSRLIRNGLMTLDEAIRELGGDPDEQLKQLAADMAKLDALKLKLDCDPRNTSQAGQVQQEPQDPTPQEKATKAKRDQAFEQVVRSFEK